MLGVDDGVAPAGRGACEHPRDDVVSGAPYQQLGGRPDQAVDGEGPTARVGARERLEESSRVERVLGVGHQVARQHDLVESATANALHRGGNGCLVPGGGDVAIAVPDLAWPANRCRRRSASHRASPIVVIHEAPSRRPTMTLGTIITDALGPSSKVNDPNATGPLPGTCTWSSMSSDSTSSRHHCGCAGHAVLTGDGETRRLTPGRETVGAAGPGDDALVRQGVQQRSGVSDRDGARDGAGTGRGAHK